MKFYPFLLRVLILFLCFHVSPAQAQLNATYSFNGPNVDGTWLKIGTLTLPQQGETVSFRFYGGSGYNALNIQNAYVELLIRTSNANSVDANGFAFSAYATRYGYMTGFIGLIKIVPNLPGISVTAYDIYLAAGPFIGNSFYQVIGGPNASWTHAISQTIPGAGYDVPMSFRTMDDSYLANSLFVSMSTGNVGIGTDQPSTKLAVNGDITSKKVKVTQTGWADFVFEEDYALPTLSAIEAYIKEHKHLPNVPSAKEVDENGLDLGQTQANLLQKIEELTLHLIEQNKQLKAQQQLLEEQGRLIKQLQQK